MIVPSFVMKNRILNGKEEKILWKRLSREK